MATISKLHLASIPGSMPAYYSPHQKARARALQSLLAGELRFYEDVFQTHYEPITVVVLDPEQWRLANPNYPYGMPSMSSARPWVFYMPSDWEAVQALPLPKRDTVDAFSIARVKQSGQSWSKILIAAGDGIGTHEIGHSLARQLSINPQTRWFGELLASYFGYAYLQAKHPDQVLGFNVFSRNGLTTSHPFTALNDFETHYSELASKYPNNYGWYQFAFESRMVKVYREQGVNFLLAVQKNFPAHGPKLTTEQVLDKLEGINPGWKEWAAHLEAGDIHPSDYPLN